MLSIVPNEINKLIMRRFLDWTAGQAASPTSNNGRNSFHHYHPHQQQTSDSVQDTEIQHLTQLLHETNYMSSLEPTRQSITAKELRKFLRLGKPLRCKNLDEIEVNESYDETRQKLTEWNNNKCRTASINKEPKEKILTQRIELLVSMMIVPTSAQQALYNIGGCYILIGIVAQAETRESFSVSIKSLVYALASNSDLQAQMENINGYQILSVLYWRKKHLLDSHILQLTFALITSTTSIDKMASSATLMIQQAGAFRELICESFDLWVQTDMINLVLEFIYDLVSSTYQDKSNSSPSLFNNTRAKNLKCLQDMDLLPRMLRLLPKYNPPSLNSNMIGDYMKTLSENNNQADEHSQSCNFDTKAVYLIKQIVFELLNKTPRQSDILYFGQFTASLLPTKGKERRSSIVNLRNILLKSLLQMMTKNKQKEVNHAMQEELVRILGFDWFMLFFSASYLNYETITVGFLNLMIILSNDDLYTTFKTKPNTSKGGWLKEPTFPTIDGKSNIQLLGMNVGVFFNLSGNIKAARHEILEASNFFLLSNCLANLVELPCIYLMIFYTMMSRMTKLETTVLETIETFDYLNLEILCDRLVGDTHHMRRKTLSILKFRCKDLTICLLQMIQVIMQRSESKTNVNVNVDQYPNAIIRFLMYLYNNNLEFQQYCQTSAEFIDALSEMLTSQVDSPTPQGSLTETSSSPKLRKLIQHSATREVLELSRLIILDTMTDTTQVTDSENLEYLHTFERFLETLSDCKEAQEELVDIILSQILLMIDSTARHNSMMTIGSSENVLQFRLLLINSISISQVVADKIWQQNLYSDNFGCIVTVVDDQLCLSEQIFNFSELLPSHQPPYPFTMQRVLNRILLFALSRPMQHMSDKMVMLDLLKKILDHRTIIILNHMHSPQSAEFFVCFAHCLMKIIEENSRPVSAPINQQTSGVDRQPLPMERQHGFSSLQGRSDSSLLGQPSSLALMLISMARKVWDAVYQSKKGILSEAFDISLSLPAFTLNTSLDLIQLKPDIGETCDRYWTSFVESQQRPKSRLQQRHHEQATGASTTSAVNLLSGKLSRVVNAANFVSRVVGATAGTMASNVNLVGEKFSQNRSNRREPAVRTKSDLQASSYNHSSMQSQTRTNQDTPLFKCTFNNLQMDEVSRVHVSIIKGYIQSHISQKEHKLALHRYVCDEWLETEYEVLLRERAIFGPDYGSELDKWCLDLTEGPRRMRKKMVNYTKQFYKNYPYTPEQYNPSNKSLRYRRPMSYDSHLYYIKTHNLDDHLLELSDKPSTIEIVNETGPVVEDDMPPIEIESSKYMTSVTHTTEGKSKEEYRAVNTGLATSIQTVPVECYSSIESLPSPSRIALTESGSSRPSELEEDGDTTSFVDFSPELEAETNSARVSENIDSLSVLRLLEKNERISHMFRCSRVQGLDTYEGLLLFGREHFYLIDGFTLLKTREIKDIDSLPPDGHDPIVPNSTPNILGHSKKTCTKFSFDSIVEVHKRRYLLQPIALEVFSSDGRNALIAFPRSIRNKVYSRFMTVSTQLTSNVHESLAGQKSSVSVEGGSGLLSSLIGETSVTQRWVRGELSNFQYLMNLNTIAGRSYNDLMQYPIFPWILADYTSDCLDLNNPATFRDLSRPVGAQTSDRLEQFKRRYAEWDDTETPPYHYGTFYSSAMIVASYMVRMEPFTQHFLRLQGGHFDLADRMFHSIHDSWLSASKHNMADIKELIPEFFYLPEFLKNDNKYDLGIKQNGMKLNNVILPPWAKDDTREFIRVHRSALESDYVSAHLHEWIDLIFGYKQQGQAAVEAVNVFHHLFYEGNVDIYNTDIDPIKKNAVIGFINNFGQVPKQLFRKPHPMRKVTSSSFSNAPSSIPLTPILPSLTTRSNTNSTQRNITNFPLALKQSNMVLKDLRCPVGQIVQMDKDIVAVEQNKLLIPPEYCRYVSWGHPDRSLRLGLYDSERPIFVWEGCDNLAPNEILCCTIPNSRTMITAGTASVITVWKIEKTRSFNPILNLYGHVEPVTCLASSQAYSLIVSGSRDRTAIIWDLNRFTFVRQLGAKLSERHLHQGPISAIAINDSTGDIATCASSGLFLWTVNGQLLAFIDSLSDTIQRSLGRPQSISMNASQLHILSVCFSQHNEWSLDEVIVTGASDGSVAIWSMRYFQSPLTGVDLEDAQQKLDNVIKQESELESSESKDDGESGVDNNPTESIKSLSNTRHLENELEDYSQKTSKPIDIIPNIRQRTDTMNSDWVKLSTTSTSTIETLPTLGLIGQTNDSTIGTDSCDSFNANESTDFLSDNSIEHAPTCSTPISFTNTTTKEEEQTTKERLPTTIDNINLNTDCHDDDNSSAGNLSAVNDEIDGQSTSKANLFLVAQDPSLLKFSKSDTSLVDSFVMLGESFGGAGAGACSPNQPTMNYNQADRVRPQSSGSSHRVRKRMSNTQDGGAAPTACNSNLWNINKLLPNHCWRRELYLRALLPRRNGKSNSPPVTSLTLSKDHKSVFVGDASGKITSWSTN